nr:Chain A, Alpha-synuclein [Homo sapiens]
GAVVTGVTAVA